MADFKGVNSTLYATKGALLQHGVWDGSVRVHHDSYTTVGEAVNDRIFIGQLPPMGIFLFAQISVEALGAGTTLSLGDAGSATRYLPATSTAAAGTINAAAVAGAGYRNTTQTPIDLFLTVGGAALTAGRVIKVSTFAGRV